MILWVLVVLVTGGARCFDPTDVPLRFVNKTLRPISIDAGQTIK